MSFGYRVFKRRAMTPGAERTPVYDEIEQVTGFPTRQAAENALARSTPPTTARYETDLIRDVFEE